MHVSFCVLGLCALIAITSAQDISGPAWAWVREDGSLVSEGGAAKLNVTHIETGTYCIQAIGFSLGTYAPVIVTLQDFNGGPFGSWGVAKANTGTGNDCNPYGGVAVFTASITALGSLKAADWPFSIVVYPY